MTSAAYPSQQEAGRQPATLPDVLDRILDKGLVIAGDVTLQLLDVEILTIKVRLLLASAERAEQMGIDWWKHDSFLSSQVRQDEQNQHLQERIDKLESLLESVSSHSEETVSGSTSDNRGQDEAPEDASDPGSKTPEA